MASSSSAGSKSVPMDTKDDTDTITGLDDDVVGHIILVSQDGEQFKVPKQFAFISRLVKESMEEAGGLVLYECVGHLAQEHMTCRWSR